MGGGNSNVLLGTGVIMIKEGALKAGQNQRLLSAHSLGVVSIVQQCS